MRKSWKWALCLGVVSLLLLGGCGKEKTEPVDLVLVTDGSEVASDAVYQSAWNGLAPVSYTHLTLPTNREV